MNFKSILFSVLFLAVIGSTFATGKKDEGKTNVDRKACKFVESQIELIEKFHNLEDGYSNDLIVASKFLGEITNLKSEWSYSCLAAEPTSDVDVKNWKNWFEANKHKLYWDDQLKTVRKR